MSFSLTVERKREVTLSGTMSLSIAIAGMALVWK